MCRKKPNRSGSTSVVIVDKRAGKVCYLKTIGVSSDPKEIEDLFFQGKKWISQQKCERDMFLEHTRDMTLPRFILKQIFQTIYAKQVFPKTVNIRLCK